MAPASYGNGFCSLFIAELQSRGSPSYPASPWFTALREADHVWRVEAIRRATLERHWTTGVEHRYDIERREYLPPAARSRETRALDAACTRFLSSRGIPVVSFGRY